MEENTQNASEALLLKPERKVGIVGYGAYVPRYRLPATEINRIWKGEEGGTPIKEKAVPGLDEDVVTMSIEAARNALSRAEISAEQLRAVWVGSEIASLRGQAQRNDCGGSHRRCAQRLGRRLGVRLQGRHRSRGGGDGAGWVAHGRVRPGDRHGYCPGTPRRRPRIHGGGRRCSLHHRPGGRIAGGD